MNFCYPKRICALSSDSSGIFLLKAARLDSGLIKPDSAPVKKIWHYLVDVDLNRASHAGLVWMGVNGSTNNNQPTKPRILSQYRLVQYFIEELNHTVVGLSIAQENLLAKRSSSQVTLIHQFTLETSTATTDHTNGEHLVQWADSSILVVLFYGKDRSSFLSASLRRDYDPNMDLTLSTTFLKFLPKV